MSSALAGWNCLGQIQRPLVAAALQQQGQQQHNAGCGGNRRAHGHFLGKIENRRDYMTESEFNELSGAVFARIESAVDASGAEIECSLNGPVLELECADGSQIVINRHTPNREIWLAAKSGGFHYSCKNGRWTSVRDGSELYEKLRELVKTATGTSVTF
jgi:CyaY protein